MKPLLLLSVGLGLALSGCITKSAAEIREHDAFAAGQRQALLSMARSPAQSLDITIKGDVQNPTVPWTENMTLAKLIVAAGYKGRSDPRNILILRNGRAIQVDPGKLLNGQDVPVLPMDIVVLE